MKYVKNITAKTKEGEDLVVPKDNVEVTLNMYEALLATLENSQYKNSKEILRAIDIRDSVKDQKEKEFIAIQDEAYEFVRMYFEVYPPLLSFGFAMVELYREFDEATSQKPKELKKDK